MACENYRRVTDQFFFFNDTATTEIYTLSLHDALPILQRGWVPNGFTPALCHATSKAQDALSRSRQTDHEVDRKSTRLNSSHLVISYAVFCLKKKHAASARRSFGARTTAQKCATCIAAS